MCLPCLENQWLSVLDDIPLFLVKVGRCFYDFSHSVLWKFSLNNYLIELKFYTSCYFTVEINKISSSCQPGYKLALTFPPRYSSIFTIGSSLVHHRWSAEVARLLKMLLILYLPSASLISFFALNLICMWLRHLFTCSEIYTAALMIIRVRGEFFHHFAQVISTCLKNF